MELFNPNFIRNFCVISHVDHGKSTLADRLLEHTRTVLAGKMKPQFLDSMDLEQERGITIKMHPVRMVYRPSQIQNPESKIQNNLEIRNSKLEITDSEYILNLIDTPGHVDFNYEVSRSLAAVEGAILLVDATKGIQAQTVGNLELARQQGLAIIPVINKIDMPQARIEETEKEIADLLKIDQSQIIRVSAKNGTNVEQVLEAVIKEVRPPSKFGGGRTSNELRALIFDSKFDAFKGVVAYVRIFDGEIKKGETIHLIQGGVSSEVKEVGIFRPDLSPVESLGPGEIGYIATGIKESGRVRVGDTITNYQLPITNYQITALPGYKEPQPKVFLSIYPEDPNNFEMLKTGLEKLKLNDAALTFKPELKEGLGRGFQCGFLGLLHAEIISERLKREFSLELVLSVPSVLYKITDQKNKESLIYTSADWPEQGVVNSQELWSRLQVLTSVNYLGQVMDLIKAMEARHQKTDYLGSKVELIYETPLREIITKNFYDKLKGATQGFASMNYEILDWRPAELVKLDILILGKKEDALSRVVPEKEAFREGKRIVEKLKEVLPSQLFSVPLQAAVGGKIVARETIGAKRRDVIAPLYGGDYTRKRKLLEQQKKGKKELKAKGEITISSKIFLEMLK